VWKVCLSKMFATINLQFLNKQTNKSLTQSTIWHKFYMPALKVAPQCLFYYRTSAIFLCRKLKSCINFCCYDQKNNTSYQTHQTKELSKMSATMDQWLLNKPINTSLTQNWAYDLDIISASAVKPANMIMYFSAEKKRHMIFGQKTKRPT